jgi:hypothetical protein
VKPDISEFSYGYAVTEALVRRWRPNLDTAPVFPSLIEEGGLGYDVNLVRRGVPYFLQFKLSDCMVRGTVYEARQGLLDVPFYRMLLRPSRHSQQHQLLCDLEARGRIVRYVAPMFHRATEFNNAYVANQILQRSLFLRPLAIGPLPDGSDHHVSFRDRQAWWFMSEPRRGRELVDEEKFETDIRAELHRAAGMALTADALNELMAEMISILVSRREERPRDPWKGIEFERLLDLPNPLAQVAYLSRTFFGADCLVVWERQ